jgi:multidrug efflux pump subunit AcrA (membrane-fusion protein)
MKNRFTIVSSLMLKKITVLLFAIYLTNTSFAEDNGSGIVIDLNKSFSTGINLNSNSFYRPSILQPDLKNTNSNQNLSLGSNGEISVNSNYKNTPSSSLLTPLNYRNFSNLNSLPGFKINCANDPFAGLYQPNIFGMIGQTDNIMNNLECSNIKYQKNIGLRFSESYCSTYSKCVSTISDQIASLGMKQIIADEYANFMIRTQIGQMEAIEKLNLFAHKKYKDQIKTSCGLHFDYDSADKNVSAKCDPSLVDNVFSKMQENCDPNISSNCVRDLKFKGEDFNTIHSNKKNQSSVVKFYMAKVSSEVEKLESTQQDALMELVKVISAPENEKQKLKNLSDALTKLNKEKKLDPILGFEVGDFSFEVFKQSQLYKKLNAIISKHHNKFSASESASLLDEFDKMRVDLVSVYNTQSCKSIKTFNEICISTKGLKDGDNKVNDVFTMNPDAYFPKEKNTYLTENSILVNISSAKQKQDFFIMLESLRCKAYNYSKKEESGSGGVGIGGFGTGGGINSYNNNLSITGIMYNNSPSTSNGFSGSSSAGFEKYNTLDYYNSKSSEKERLANLTFPDSPLVSKLADATPKVETIPSDNTTVAESASPSVLEPITPNSTTSSIQSTNEFNTLSNNFMEEKEPDNTNKVSVEKNTDLNDKVDSLSKKLANSEAQIDKMNKDREVAAQEARFQSQQSAYDSELESLNYQIKNLQKENASLQAQGKNELSSSKTSIPDSTSGESQNTESQFEKTNSSYTNNDNTNGHDRSEEPRNEIAASASGPSNSGSSYYSTGSGESVSGSASKSTQSTGSGSANTNSSSRPGLTLTRIDDMSSEKVEETIYALIETNNGKPFTVVEGGFFKEIIPLIVVGKVQIDSKTGKPIFQKITKGKVVDDKNTLIAKASVSNQAIESKADLLRAEDDRLKRERVEYLKLKKQALEALKLPH